jgi:hypothetical protein
MKLLFSASSLGNAFNELTTSARGYVPSQLRSGELAVGMVPLMNAAIRFTSQLVIELLEYAPPKDHVRDLESTLIAKLATWIDEAGTMSLRTHDMICVIGDLTRAAHHYAYPNAASVKHVMETLPRNLTIATVAFTIQLALEETELPAVVLRGLESELIRKLKEPWEFGELPLSVDVQDGPTWESLSEKE